MHRQRLASVDIHWRDNKMKVFFHAGSLSCAFAFPLALLAVVAAKDTGTVFAAGTHAGIREEIAPAIPRAFEQGGPAEPISGAGKR